MALWTPAEITTALWLDFSDALTLFDATTGGSLVSSGGAIARIEDKSGNARHAVQASAGARPVRQVSVQNGLDAGIGSGSQFMTVTSSTASFAAFHTANAVGLLIGKPGTSNNPNTLFGFIGNIPAVGGTRTGFAFLYDDRVSEPVNDRPSAGFWRNNASLSSGVQNAMTPNAYSMLSAIYDVQAATNANKVRLEVNGGQFSGSIGGSFSATTQANASADLMVFGYGPSSFYLAGGIGEIVLVTESLATEDYQKLQGYAAWKWGLQGNLPADFPYKNAAPTVSGGIIPILRQHYAAQGAR